jgi:hypothetical protein
MQKREKRVGRGRPDFVQACTLQCVLGDPIGSGAMINHHQRPSISMSLAAGGIWPGAKANCREPGRALRGRVGADTRRVRAFKMEKSGARVVDGAGIPPWGRMTGGVLSGNECSASGLCFLWLVPVCS